MAVSTRNILFARSFTFAMFWIYWRVMHRFITFSRILLWHCICLGIHVSEALNTGWRLAMLPGNEKFLHIRKVWALEFHLNVWRVSGQFGKSSDSLDFLVSVKVSGKFLDNLEYFWNLLYRLEIVWIVWKDFSQHWGFFITVVCQGQHENKHKNNLLNWYFKRFHNYRVFFLTGPP